MKRSELPDEVFGIPQERKYPMPDKKHTESAIKLFNHVDSKYEEQLAKKIISNMKKYKIDSSMVGPNNRLRKYLPKDMIKEVGTTAGTVVGTGQTSDSVYLVNYMPKNTFSSNKRSRYGICKYGMNDLHIFGDNQRHCHYVSDLNEFNNNAYNIRVFKYKGKQKKSIYQIIEDAESDLDFYTMLTGRGIPDREFIVYDSEFVEEECILDTLESISECVEAKLRSVAQDLKPIPVLTETVQGRPYNYYRDLNGIFIQHELTGIRSSSYPDIKDIPESTKRIVERGYYI